MNEEVAFNEWAQEHFRMTASEFRTCVILVTGYRKKGRPVTKVEIEVMLAEVSGRQNAPLLKLERRGLAMRGPKVGASGLLSTWLPLPRLERLLDQAGTEIKSGVRACVPDAPDAEQMAN